MLDTNTECGQRVARRLEGERIAWLTTVGSDGTPQPRPVWFLWTGDEFLVYSRPGTRKLEHITRNPRVSLNLDGDGLGGGWYIFPKTVLESYHEVVADETGGAALAATLAQLEAQGYEIWGDRYKRVPRAYPQDHPQADLLKYKGIFAKGQDLSHADLTSPALVDRCYDICAGVVSLQEWLGRIS